MVVLSLAMVFEHVSSAPEGEQFQIFAAWGTFCAGSWVDAYDAALRARS